MALVSRITARWPSSGDKNLLAVKLLSMALLFPTRAAIINASLGASGVRCLSPAAKEIG